MEEFTGKKEAARILKPDSPKKQHKRRNRSSTRIPCPVVAGTSSTPPPRKPQTPETKEEPQAKKSRVDLSSCAQTDSPSADIVVIESNVQVDLTAFRPTNEECKMTDEFQKALNSLDRNNGSDVEVEDASDFEEFTFEQLGPSEAQHLNEIDSQNDYAIRKILTGDDLVFDWRSDPSTFQGERETFTGIPGPTFPMAKGTSPLKVFEKIWTEELMKLIVDQTNKYAESELNSDVLKNRSRMKTWTPVTKEEMWIFISILIYQGIHPLPVEREYWHPNPSFITISQLHGIMPYDRFLILKKCLHFVENDKLLPNATLEQKRLYKIQPIIDHLNEKFSELYYPDQDLALDESLLLWKGRLSFAQKISTKAAEVGVKTYELCESKSGYLYKFIVYAGKRDSDTQKRGKSLEPNAQDHPAGATAKIVFDLARPLFNKGHTLVMDNFYNSPLLSRALKKNGMDTMGTLRLNRQFVPDMLKNINKNSMKVGEIAFSQTTDLSVLVWKDTNFVSMISSYHKCGVGGKGKFGKCKYRPQVVLDYNLVMGAVVKKAQTLSAFPIERVRNLLWYKKLFRRMLNVAILNASILLSHHKKMPQREFRLELLSEIIRKFKFPLPIHLQPILGNRPPTIVTNVSNVSLPRPKLVNGHYIEKGATSKARCKWCSKRGRTARTAWRCDTCKIPLCIEFCFKEYHT